MSIDVNIVAEARENVVLAPAESLIGGHLQIVGPDNTIEIRPVTAGIAGTRQVEIVTGASEGETVVSPALDGLAAGDRVRVR
jgi:multidrug efflux pump subunit AcrA (membrane-fusion protein)